MIPLLRPELPKQEIINKFFKQSIHSGMLSNFGPCYNSLEPEIWNLTQRYPVIVNSGTAAIDVALRTILKKGSKVLIPDFTHVGTLSAVVNSGCIPIFVKCSKRTWTLSIKEIIKHKKEYDAFIVVSPFGYTVDTQQYDEISKKLNKPVIYDFAGGFGMQIDTYNPVCFSMHATKNLSCGEGGIALFENESLMEKAKRIINFDILPNRDINSIHGYNFKAQEITCAIALASLQERSYEDKIILKRKLINYYQSKLPVIHHDLHLGSHSAPSMCVVSGLSPSLMNKIKNKVDFEFKQYYPLLSKMEGLSEIKRFSTSHGFFRSTYALPSDCSFDEAKDVVNALVRYYLLEP